MESCHILRSNVAAKKKKAKISTHANLSELLTTQIVEVSYANHILAVDHDDSPLVTVKLESGNYLRFQPDSITRTERHHTEVSLPPLSCGNAILAWQQLLSSKRLMHFVGLFPKPIAHWSK